MKRELSDWKLSPGTGQRFWKGDILDYLKKSKHLWMIPLYGVFYMLSFTLVEKSEARIHIIHSLADDRIPFCPYFIFPDWHNRLFCTVLFEQEGILSVYWHSGSGHDSFYPGLLCVSKWTESSSGSERGERSFCFGSAISVQNRYTDEYFSKHPCI